MVTVYCLKGIRHYWTIVTKIHEQMFYSLILVTSFTYWCITAANCLLLWQFAAVMYQNVNDAKVTMDFGVDYFNTTNSMYFCS